MAKVDNELDLAWRRAKADAGDRGFVSHPYLIDWIEHDRGSWITHLNQKLAAGYSPHSALTCLAPKPGWMLRPGAVLTPDDEVIYNLLVGRMTPQIWQHLKWSQGKNDISYQLQPQSTSTVRWVRRGAGIWREWREKSVAQLTPQISHVVETDISGFYENIDINRLLSDLRALNVCDNDLQLLRKCLKRWAATRGKGIPQGYTASDILAKVYINPIDRSLNNEAIQHLRYVDDIRIFCGSKRDAKLAVRSLTELVSHRGLNLQSAKTRIMSKPEAEAEFKGAAQLLEDLASELKEEFQVVAAGGYESTKAVFKALRSSEGPPPEILERTFNEKFSVATEERFDKSLFHYLLSRLGAARSRVAVSYCLDALVQRPEETASILRYLQMVPLNDDEVTQIIDYMTSPDAIYDYQLYQLMKWFWDTALESDRVLALARQWAYDQNRKPWLRVYCTSYLGRHGESVDLDTIENHYDSVGTDLERAGCVAALSRLEIGRRNAFYAKVEDDGVFVKHAVRFVTEA